ncbi:cathelicidin-related peptide Oh-Cath-like [Alligator mississippiensis]|uniref:cathelicidin-related peptide Oh-Cath-like n=1 Tax=Alligator mississippiensis TaxID=8496 RepID=UPI002877365F|nr:cathelicidin-related peptide Oh-Cath-like [Alligator mississippiensis]
MQPCRTALLVLGVAVAVAVAVALPAPLAPAPAPAPSSYQEALAAAVNTYNQESGLPQAYRLLEAEPQPQWDLASQPVQPLKFSIKETECLLSEKRDIGQCPFKDKGLVKDCTGIYSVEKKPPIVTAKCEDAGQGVKPRMRLWVPPMPWHWPFNRVRLG